jgi:hypothetical protein|tara:strand:+ start:709 stop:1296 length:588 start_codon:yes stop_codon:yes gene_type:complete
MKNSISAIILSCCVSTAFAADDFHFGIEGGLVASEIDVDDGAQSLANKTGRTIYYTRERGAPSFRIFGTFPTSENVNIEIGYLNTSSIDVDFSASGTTDTINAAVEISGLDFGIKYNPKESFYLKAGVHRYKIESNVTGQIAGYTFVSSSETGIGPFFGAGYQANEHLTVGINFLASIGGNSDNSASYAYVGYQF